MRDDQAETIRARNIGYETRVRRAILALMHRIEFQPSTDQQLLSSYLGAALLTMARPGYTGRYCLPFDPPRLPSYPHRKQIVYTRVAWAVRALWAVEVDDATVLADVEAAVSALESVAVNYAAMNIGGGIVPGYDLVLPGAAQPVLDSPVARPAPMPPPPPVRGRPRRDQA